MWFAGLIGVYVCVCVHYYKNTPRISGAVTHLLSLVPYCASHVAAEHGFCNAPNECLCVDGYSGDNCDMDDDVCGHQQPCAMGSTCVNTGPDQYVCTCPSGFTGQNCGEETDECSPDPCQNGATCTVGYLTPSVICTILSYEPCPMHFCRISSTTFSASVLMVGQVKPVLPLLMTATPIHA